MIDYVLKRINHFSPIAETIIEIEKLSMKSIKEEKDLLKIIEKDPFVMATLLKVANSKLFGCSSKVETPIKAIHLLGINFTILTIKDSVQNLLERNLEPYQITKEDFVKASILSCKLANLWVSKFDNQLKNDILLPVFLQELGKFILSELLILENKFEEFINLNKINKKIVDNENFLLGTCTSKVTAEIFRRWNLSTKLIGIVEFVDDIDNCNNTYKKHAQILDIIKTSCNPKDLLSNKNIEEALKKVINYQLDKVLFIDSINALKIEYSKDK